MTPFQERIHAKAKECLRCHTQGEAFTKEHLTLVESWAENHYREPCFLKICDLTDDEQGFIYKGNGEDVAFLPHYSDAVKLYADDMPEMTEREFQAWRRTH